MIVFDSDDFGASHIISDQCRSHDCRDQLDKFHIANPSFKATLFTIPDEMTRELLDWCQANQGWIELAVHGIKHTSNYECAEMSYNEFDGLMSDFDRSEMIDQHFVKGFKAPGWQISQGIYEWLHDNDWWVADQPYNDERRPKGLKVYKIDENALHTHTWDCVGNGVYEKFDEIIERVKYETEFKFVSEVVV